MKISTLRFLVLVLAAVLLMAANHHSFAGSATWAQVPTDNAWNDPPNWVKNTVPNGPDDIATFDATSTPNPQLFKSVEVNAIVFTATASAISIYPSAPYSLTISGSGIINNSPLTQTVHPLVITQGTGSSVQLRNSASAGDRVSFEIERGSAGGDSSFVSFSDTSDAGSATLHTIGSKDSRSTGGLVFFEDNSSAADATLSNEGGAGPQGAGVTELSGFASAGHATFANNGATISKGTTRFVENATAANATIVSNGAAGEGRVGGATQFYDGSTAGAATLSAETGVGSGGAIQFFDESDGGTSTVRVFGNGILDISGSLLPLVAIGSLEGDGLVYLGWNDLAVGTNSLSTSFSGVLADGAGDSDNGTGGSLTKIGSGTFTLTGANTYTGSTEVNEGVLLTSNETGSATGTGPISVNAGTLGGSGVIAGAVTLGTGSGAGAFLAPAHGTKKQTTLTIQSGLTFNSDSTYTYTFKAKGRKAKTDKVIANGVTIKSGASITVSGQAQGTLTQGLVLTVVSNTSATPISGAFSNLADGAILTVNGNKLQADYQGGDGNDLTLTVVP